MLSAIDDVTSSFPKALDLSGAFSWCLLCHRLRLGERRSRQDIMTSGRRSTPVQGSKARCARERGEPTPWPMPPLLMRPIRCLSPLDDMRGVRPSQAAKCRAERNWRDSPTAATRAGAVKGPTPGIAARRRLASFVWSARARLHPNSAVRQPAEELDQLAARRLSADHRLAGNVDVVNLKD
jgi:hypothetical protein